MNYTRKGRYDKGERKRIGNERVIGEKKIKIKSKILRGVCVDASILE